MPPSSASAWVEALPWAEACLVGFAFTCGAALGSFLNVVAYRVPRGESPVLGGSRCPTCGCGILPRDNVPVLGWLLLRGRCRGCHAAIPPRYVLVEVACGVLLACLAVVRIACDPHGLDRLLVQGDLRPLLVFAGQSAVLMALVAWSLLAERGHRVSSVTYGLTAAVVLGWFVLAATLHEPPAEAAGASSRPWLDPVLQALAGGGIGWLMGSLLRRQPESGSSMSAADRDMLTVAGLALGWQPVMLVAVVTVTLHAFGCGTLAARYCIPPATLLAMSLCGRWLAGLTWVPGWLR